MEQIIPIAALLGEENLKRLKDGITDLLLEQVSQELNDMSVWLIDYESLLDEIREDLKADIKKKILPKYLEVVETKVDALFQKQME